jgi:hypothetical protein
MALKFNLLLSNFTKVLIFCVFLCIVCEPFGQQLRANPIHETARNIVVDMHPKILKFHSRVLRKNAKHGWYTSRAIYPYAQLNGKSVPLSDSIIAFIRSLQDSYLQESIENFHSIHDSLARYQVYLNYEFSYIGDSIISLLINGTFKILSIPFKTTDYVFHAKVFKVSSGESVQLATLFKKPIESVKRIVNVVNDSILGVLEKIGVKTNITEEEDSETLPLQVWYVTPRNLVFFYLRETVFPRFVGPCSFFLHWSDLPKTSNLLPIDKGKAY